MKIGYHAPLPPARTGVAAYAESLRVALSERLPLAVGAEDAGLDLYQIGNNALHWPIYQRALRRPGVVLLHDAVLHHLLLGQLDRTAYIEEFVHNYGEWHRQTAERLWERRASSAADPKYFERPLLRRLADASRLMIVHNPAARREVVRHSPQARVELVPHLFSPPRDHFYRELDEYRDQVLQIGRDKVLFAVLGHLRESKRLDTVLTVFERLVRQGLPVHLLVQGEFVGEDLQRALAFRLDRPWITRRGYLSEDEWWMQAHVLDAAINLRWPLAGESSGIATRLMGIGRPVILTRSEETAELPEVAALRVDPGLPEREQLEHFVAWLTLNEPARRSIGRHAAIHTRQFHSLPVVADRIAALLADVHSGSSAPNKYPEPVSIPPA